jgi:hypothetical protein
MDAPKIFTTEKIAQILQLPEWRVVRFAQIKSYGIKPAFGDASGPGSRRLYDLENVCEMALISWLLNAGFRGELIGRVLREVRDHGGLSFLLKEPFSKAKDQHLGIIRRPKGKITGQHVVFVRGWEQLENIFARDSNTSLLIIPVGRRFQDLAREVIVERDGD